MEPYLDSLAKGLIVKTETDSRDKIQNRPENPGNLSSNPTSGSNDGVAQLAAAIRARRAKSPETSGLRAGRNQNKQLISKPSSAANSDLSGSQINRRLNSETLLKAYLKGRRDFACFNISLLNLEGADLSGTNFHSAQLRKTNLQGANLENTDFGRASLMQTNLRDANLTKAYLSHADLEGADLRGADLSYAYISQANLRGTNLCGANLTGAKVTDEQLALAKINWLTVRPNGKRGFL
jgi:serine/threonine-protein kinase